MEGSRLSERAWWALTVAFAVALLLWGAVRSGVPAVAWCRASGGTPTTEPTTMALAPSLSAKPVPVVIAVCNR